jgi:hypothetical protein
MHAYSTDSAERRMIPLFLALAAIGTSIGVAHLLAMWRIGIPAWLSPLDTMTFYGLFYWLFDRVVWRWRWVHRLHLTNVPDISGLWQGHVTTTRMAGAAVTTTPTAITFTIRHTWTELAINGRSEQSVSNSLSAHMLVLSGCSVSYEYTNEPLASAPDTMHAHRGLASLSLTGYVLRGEYYSGRDRQNIGTIEVQRAPRRA